jgi:dTDP-4-amino-4,6-dideoxygalactose transaminase
MEQLDYFLQRKRALAQRYAQFFATTSMRFRMEIEGSTANYWLMCVETENKEQRDALLQQTNAQKVMTRPIWQLMYRLPMYQHCWRDAQINAEFLEERIVNIPSSAL